MANKDLAIGDRVRLSFDSSWATRNPTVNPLGISGTISSSEAHSKEWAKSWVVVVWDNGIENHYRAEDCDLLLYEE